MSNRKDAVNVSTTIPWSSRYFTFAISHSFVVWVGWVTLHACFQNFWPNITHPLSGSLSPRSILVNCYNGCSVVVPLVLTSLLSPYPSSMSILDYWHWCLGVNCSLQLKQRHWVLWRCISSNDSRRIGVTYLISAKGVLTVCLDN